jgi:hypothetical protein
MEEPSSYADVQGAPAPASTYASGGSAITTWLVVFVGFLIAMWALPLAWKGVDDEFHAHVSLWNFVVNTFQVGLGIVLLKLVFNRFQVNGLTQIVNTM